MSTFADRVEKRFSELIAESRGLSYDSLLKADIELTDIASQFRLRHMSMSSVRNNGVFKGPETDELIHKLIDVISGFALGRHRDGHAVYLRIGDWNVGINYNYLSDSVDGGGRDKLSTAPEVLLKAANVENSPESRAVAVCILSALITDTVFTQLPLLS